MSLTKTSKPTPLEADSLVHVSTKLHAEARRRVRVAAAEKDLTTAEVLRAIVYGHFGLSHLPVVLPDEAAPLE